MCKLTNKERFDISTMVYFIPTNSKHRIYPNDKVKMADLSSRGIKPTKVTKGLTLLQWGKTYRDEQITAYKRDITAGYLTKYEIIQGLPPRFRDWIWKKIENTPYDVDGDTSRILVSMYHNDLHKVGAK